jgi:photosystem II stability/assembly factor-like uncharacterized protein
MTFNSIRPLSFVLIIIPWLLPLQLSALPESPLPQQTASKAVWEPINYPKDVQFSDVFFVDDETGWIAGGIVEGGFIIHTTDGGGTWTVQAGDPDGAERGYDRFRFIDAKHGWATQTTGLDVNLLATRDGQQWDVVGHIPAHYHDYLFTTASDGFMTSGANIYVTHDGGHTWTEVFQANVQGVVNGLTRSASCNLYSISFPTPLTGFVLGSTGDIPGVAYLFKTEDGGVTWTSVSSPIGDANEATIFFTDPMTGVLRIRDERVFNTTDGGTTWRGVPGTAGPIIRFADPEVGWSFSYNKLCFTVDGGKRWVSREFRFPETPRGFSFPSRDLAYLVGYHGMIYRYRTATNADMPKNAVPAPPMPPITADPEPASDQLKEDVTSLTESLHAAEPSGSMAASTPASTSAMNGIPFIDRCCKTQLAKISDLVRKLVEDVPQIVGRYRNLNLITFGLKMATELPSNLEQIQTALDGLRQAKDAKSALDAATSLTTAVDGFRAALDNDSLGDPPQSQ